MTSIIQRSLAGGELAPALYARADQTKYATGLKTCRNFMVQRHGGAASRPGTRFIAEVPGRVRLMKFVFNAEQTYVLVFGHQYIRFIRDGGMITNPDGSVYQIGSPYQDKHLDRLQYVQSGDVVTIVHPTYRPRELKRSGHTDWTLTDITTMPDIQPPTNVSATAGTGAATADVKVTGLAVNAQGMGSGSVRGGTFKVAGFNDIGTGPASDEIDAGAGLVFTSITLAWTNIPIADGYAIYERDANGTFSIIGTTRSTSYSVPSYREPGIPISKAPTAASGEYDTYEYVVTSIEAETFVESRASDPVNVVGEPPTGLKPNIINWDAAPNAAEYNVYKRRNGILGFVGVAEGTQFEDDNINPDISQSPPEHQDLFYLVDQCPGQVSYFQQRLIFARTNAETEKLWFSRSADFDNFSTRRPLQADDSFSFPITGKQVNEIRHLLDLGQLVVFTSGAEYIIQGDADDVLRPGYHWPRAQGYNGSSWLSPVVIGNSAIYVQARGSVIRDLAYQQESEGYVGNDLTIFATHLFDGYTITGWDYQQIPDSIVWCVRSDGTLLGLTYVREHGVWGWHRHDTAGKFESVVSIPDGLEDGLYISVKRTIRGVDRWYVERLETRRIEDVVDAFFVDSGLTYDGRNTDSKHWMRIDGSGWSHDDVLTVGSNYDYFSADDVGNAIVFDDGGRTLVCSIVEFIGSKHVSVRPERTVPNSLRNKWTAAWSKAVDTLGGIDHLEGEYVAVLADGNVIDNGIDDPVHQVIDGAIHLSRPASVVHVGLPYTCDLETLNLDNPNGETLADKTKNATHVTLLVESSRGIMAGEGPDKLMPYAQREYEDWGEPTRMKTGYVHVPILSEWNDHGRVFIRQSDPLPLNVLAIIRSGYVGE